jgi:hypothetical protein
MIHAPSASSLDLRQPALFLVRRVHHTVRVAGGQRRAPANGE